MATDQGLSSVYEPGQVERKWYQYWKDNNYFAPVNDYSKKPFSIVMPPPNVTGSLHLGHALDNTLQDILARWRRMQGLIPYGCPELTMQVLQPQASGGSLAEEGLTRQQLGREKFLEGLGTGKHSYGSRIAEQLSFLGSSS